MKKNEELLKAILNQLDEIYPRRIQNQDDMVENHQNRVEISDCLFYLKDRQFIEMKDWSSRSKKVCGLIRIIIPEGRNYLKSLS